MLSGGTRCEEAAIKEHLYMTDIIICRQSQRIRGQFNNGRGSRQKPALFLCAVRGKTLRYCSHAFLRVYPDGIHQLKTCWPRLSILHYQDS